MSSTRRKTKAPITLYQAGASPDIEQRARHAHAGKAQVLRFKPTSPSYEEIFGKPRPGQSTTGNDIAILRAYMHVKGMPEIDESEPISTFATLFSRQVLPRHKWRVFPKGLRGTAEARDCLKQWAAALLPEVLSEEEARPQPLRYSWMVPELLAYYDPKLLGLGVR